MSLERFREMDSDAGMYEHKDGAWVGYDDVRELLAAWIIKRGYSTGHGEAIEDLLTELEWQIKEALQAACNAGRNAEYFEEKYRQEVFARSTYELTSRIAALDDAIAACNNVLAVDMYDPSSTFIEAIQALKDK